MTDNPPSDALPTVANWFIPEPCEVFVTPPGSHEARIVGHYTYTGDPGCKEEWLLDFTMPDGERRMHYVDSDARAQCVVDAAYNVASPEPYQTPADELAFRCVKPSDSPSAEVTFGGERVGCIVRRDHVDARYKVSFDHPTPYGTGCDASSFDDAVRRVREMVWPRPPGSENFQHIVVQRGRGDAYNIFRAAEPYCPDYEDIGEEIRIGSATEAKPIKEGLLVSFVDPLGRRWYFRAKDTEAAIRFISERYNVGYYDGDPDKLVNRDGIWEVVPGPITIYPICDGPLCIYANERQVGTAYGTAGGCLEVELDCDNGAKHLVHSFVHARRVTAERLKAAAKVSLGEMDE